MKTKTIRLSLIAMLAITALVFQSCKKDERKTNQPPSCKITYPSNGQLIIKGEIVTISVDANDNDGNIIEVCFFIDNVDKGSATSFPHNYIWNTNNEDFGYHTLKVTSYDNSGESNSDEITFAIIKGWGSNSPPTAIFTITPNGGTTNTNFTFDASGCTDGVDPTGDLQVRWDFDNNGSWDIDWSYNKIQSHQYIHEGTYTARLLVKDTEGLTDQYTKSILVSSWGGTPPTGYFTDPRDGQDYGYIDIGNQRWMTDNLNFQTANSWLYNNSSTNGDIYGRLYTWETALTACPSGWSLPSDDDWKTLEMSLGMSQEEVDNDFWRGTNQGEQMKSTIGWNDNGNGTNSSGFNALPGGDRKSDGSFTYLGVGGFWWSSSTASPENLWSWARGVRNNYNQVGRGESYKTEAFSVRCIKN